MLKFYSRYKPLTLDVAPQDVGGADHRADDDEQPEQAGERELAVGVFTPEEVEAMQAVESLL